MDPEENLLDIPELKDVAISPATGIASLALNFALKYHDINTVQEGALYQQYKLEGRNMRDLQLDMVLETATRLELHILAAPNRITDAVYEAIAHGIIEGEGEAEAGDPDGGPTEP